MPELTKRSLPVAPSMEPVMNLINFYRDNAFFNPNYAIGFETCPTS